MGKGPDLTTAMSQAVDPMYLMQRVTDRTLELIGVATGVMVGLADEHGVTYVCGAGHKISALGTRVALGSSLSGLAVQTGEILRADDIELDDRVDREACRRLSVASLVCIPLCRANEAIGVLAVNADTPNAFTDDDVATLTRLADFVSVAIASACDLFRVGNQLLDLPPPAASPDARVVRSGRDDTASRYVMSVISPEVITRLDSGQRIQDLLDEPEALSMVFQPIVELATGQVAAVEALSRFGVMPYRTPELWFADAHLHGLGISLERLAVTKALAQLDAIPDGIALTVNAGPQVVMDVAFVELFRGMDGRRIILELTEHTAVYDYPELIASLQAMRRTGMRIAIDDTGSGYSSLAHILKLAPDFIKLDCELTSGIDIDPVRRALAASLVTFAADTGAHIIAEGVETADEMEVLRDLGIRYGQGYHLAHPSTLDILGLTARQPTGTTTPRPGSATTR